MEFALELFRVFRDAAPLEGFELDEISHFFLVQSIRVMDESRGIRKRHHPGSQLDQFFGGVQGHVSGTGDQAHLVLQPIALVLEHLFHKVGASIAGGLLTDKTAAVLQSLAGEHADEFILQALILAEHETDFPGPHADIPGGDVDIGADVFAELGHEGLAEAHDFAFGFFLGVEIGAPLAGAHGQGGQAVFEGLLETEKF